MTPKASATKGKSDKLECIEIKLLCFKEYQEIENTRMEENVCKTYIWGRTYIHNI